MRIISIYLYASMTLICLVMLYPAPQNALQFYYSPKTFREKVSSTGISALVSLPLHRFWSTKVEGARMKSNATIHQHSRDRDTDEDTYIDEETEMIKSMIPSSSRLDFNRSQNLKNAVYIYTNLVFLR